MGSESFQQFQAIRIIRCGIKSWKKQDSNFLPLCLQLLWASLPIQQDLAIHWWHLHGHWGVPIQQDLQNIMVFLALSVVWLLWNPEVPPSVDTMWYDKWYILQGLESSGRIQFKKTASSAKDYSSQLSHSAHFCIGRSASQPVMAMPQAFFLIHRFSKIPWHPRLMGRSVNVWQMIIDHRLSRFYS